MRTLTICGTDIARFAIVTKQNPDPAETTAAEFLQRVITTACGVTIPITTAPNHHSLCLGTREPSPEVKWDGFRMTTDTANVYLDGNIPRGTLYAAYDFAEKYLGWRQFAHDLEVIPTDGEAVVPAGLDTVDNPTFEERRCDWFEYRWNAEFRAKNRINTHEGTALGEELGGSVSFSGACHSLGSLLPADQYFEEHPEYYALIDGERVPCENGSGPGQPCLSNPDVLRIVTEKILAELRAHPEQTIAEVSQCDNSNFCRCEKCAAVDAEEGSHSGTMVRFVNAVAEEVEKEFPDVLVRMFAYVYSSKPPKKTKARHNVLVRYCTYEACFRHAIDDPNCKLNRENTYAEMMGWQKMCDQMSVWDYVNNWKSYIAPFPNLYSLRENVRFFHECHVVHLFEEDSSHAHEGGTWPELRAYLIGKILWNAHITLEEYNRHIDEFLAAFYGPAWREIRRYLDFEYCVTADHCCTCNEPLDNIFVYPMLPGVTMEHRKNYVERAYQTEFPDHGLTGITARIEEALGYFDRALAITEDETYRARIEKSRFSLNFLKLFCTPHDKEQMSSEEIAAYEAEIAEYHNKKKEYGCSYNIFVHPW